mgnify:CR=1 FL=1
MWAYDVLLKSDRDEHSLGRHRENDVIIADEQVSGKHCVIHKVGDGWKLRDLDSSNGTFVNGARVREFDLRDGDDIRLGGTFIKFMISKSVIADEEWEKAADRLHRHEDGLRRAIAKAGSDEAVDLDDIHLRSANEIGVQSGSQSSTPALAAPAPPRDRESDVPPSGYYEPKKFERKEDSRLNRDDYLWVAESVADIMRQLALKQQRTRRGMLTEGLEALRATVQAENGFLMLSNKETKRWVIESWVGDSSHWTEYEQKHPVPLTVANKAYKSKSLVTNAFGENEIDFSESVARLDVKCYAAIPLFRRGRRVGVLYFDTRKKMTKFQPREVELMKRVGEFVLDLDAAIRNARQQKTEKKD